MSKDLMVFNELDEEILNLYAKGYSRKDIAYQLDLPTKTINNTFNKPQVKSRLQEIVEHRELMIKAKHSEIINEITDDLIEKVDSPAELLNKGRDILDVISVSNQIFKETEKKRLGASGESVIVNILNQLS